jgi:long-chain acyl-CoA synthetase
MNYKTIPEMFFSIVDENPEKNYFNYKEDNDWVGLSGSEIATLVNQISAALLSIDCISKDKITIMSDTSYKWALCDYGILCSGMTTTTVYPTLISEQIEYILNNSETKLIFVQNKEQFLRIDDFYDRCENLEYIVILDDTKPSVSDDYVINFSKFLELGEKYILTTKYNSRDLIHNINPNDLLTLIYTSGTTGVPKGVMLSHGNIISNLKEVVNLQKDLGNETFLSFLPLSHVLERMAGHFFALSSNSKIYYAENMDTVGENMNEVSPSVVICVPRFFEKMYAKIMLGLNSSSNFKKRMFNWALNIGKDYTNISHAKQNIPFYLSIQRRVADKLIYSKVRKKLGGNIKFFISGGAPLSTTIAEFFAGIGITILEGYGLTETSPVLTSNTPEDIRFGSVGKKLNNVEIKIANDGEILAKGPNIMIGYYKNEKATNDVFDEEGWFCTGDIGEIDNDGFLKITDRKKNLIVTSAGKNIAPAPLENSLNDSRFIEQSIVIGDKRNFISAIIVPNFESVNSYLQSIGKDSLSNDAIVDHQDVINLIEQEIVSSMKKFSSFETIKKFKLIPSQFMLERGEMTPKMSIVRKKVIENYLEVIESIYN